MVSPPHCACVLYTYMYSAVLAASSRPPQAAGVRVNKEMQITPRCIFYCRRRRTHPHLPPLASIQVTKVYYFSNCPSSSRMSLSGGGNTGVFYNCTCFTPCFNPLCFRFFSTGRTVRTMTGAAVLNSTFFFPGRRSSARFSSPSPPHLLAYFHRKQNSPGDADATFPPSTPVVVYSSTISIPRRPAGGRKRGEGVGVGAGAGRTMISMRDGRSSNNFLFFPKHVSLI